MISDDYLEVYLNALEWMAKVSGWPEAQQLAMLTLIGRASTAGHGYLASQGCMWEDILNTHNLSPEVHWQHLCKIEFGPEYHPQLMGQKIVQPVCAGYGRSRGWPSKLWWP